MSGLLCKYCATPEGEAGKLFLCSACSSAHYCSVKCQRAAWKDGHKHECETMIARRDDMGASSSHAFDDMKKWCDRNRHVFMLLVNVLLQGSSEVDSMLSSHVIFLDAIYSDSQRAVEVKSHKVVTIADADEEVRKARLSVRKPQLMTDNEHNVSIRQILEGPAPNSTVEMFSVVLISFTSSYGKTMRYVPLGCEPGFLFFRGGPSIEASAADLLHCLNTGKAGFGSCGSKADKVSAGAAATDFACEQIFLGRTSTRITEVRTALLPILTELLMATLLLGSKNLSLRKTHRLRISLLHNADKEVSAVSKCEAVALATLAEGQRKYAPVVMCESRAGRTNEDSWEDLLRGATAEIIEEAARRDSVYLPIVVIEFSTKEPTAQYLLPMFLAKAELKKMASAKFSREHHEQILTRTLHSFGPIPRFG